MCQCFCVDADFMSVFRSDAVNVTVIVYQVPKITGGVGEPGDGY